MSYIATIPVVFECSRSKVYEALCDLKSFVLWSSGLTSVSHPGPLVVGLQYTTKSTVAGQVNVSKVRVVRMVPHEVIELASETGLIAYRVSFQLKEQGPGTTEVVCVLRFEFRNFVLVLARPAIEAMAEARVRGDLQALRAMICA